MVRSSRVRVPDRQPARLPVNPQLYALCRPGTDRAVTRALEEASSPWGQISKMARGKIDWGMVDDITNSLTTARQERRDDLGTT